MHAAGDSETTGGGSRDARYHLFAEGLGDTAEVQVEDALEGVMKIPSCIPQELVTATTASSDRNTTASLLLEKV